MKPDWPLIELNQLGDDFNSWRNGLAYPIQKALLRLRAMTNAGLSITDNMQAAIVTYPLTHATEYPFKSPTFRPQGFTVLSVTDAAGNLTLPVAGNPQINLNRSDKNAGWYGLTVNFASPVGEIRMLKSTNQTGLASGSIVTVTFDVEIYKRGRLTHAAASSQIVCLDAGIVEVTYNLAFAARATALGDDFGGHVQVNGNNGTTNSRYGSQRMHCQNSGADEASACVPIQVSAGDFLEVAARQFNSVAAARDIQGNQAQECQVTARYIAPASTQAANVTGILWGG